MAGGLMNVPIMRPNQCHTVPHAIILAVLLLTANTDSQNSSCQLEIKVRRGTVYNASVGEELRIHCPVTFCNNSPPAVIWYKLEIKNEPVNVSRGSNIRQEWETITSFEEGSVLIFKNILSSDSGQYQCESGGTVGHIINVYVSGVDKDRNVTLKNTINATIAPPYKLEYLWMYIYTAAGIVAFVFIVIIISVISMRGCKGKSKKETQTDNQYMAIPMVEQPPLHRSIQPPPRGSPSAPPSRRSTRKKTPTSQPEPLPRDTEHNQDKVTQDRQGQRTGGAAEEEGSSVVYAALNHQLPARPAARPRIIQEECSEYAAIRVS